MATPPLVLEIVQGVTTFTFLVPPRPFLPERECRFKEASEPPEVEEIADVWDLPNALLVSTDGTQATLWTQFAALRALVGTRAAPLTSVKAKDSAGNTLWDLTAGAYENLRIERMTFGEATPYEGADHASWRTVIPCNLRVSAVLPQADTNGIVRWSQRVLYTNLPGGLLRITWVTEISVAKGTSGGAAGKLATYGLIPVATWGDSYRYVTNGDASAAPGVDIEELDADEQNAWAATTAIGTCVLEQTGVDVGTSAPGLSPDQVSYEVTTEESADGTVYTYVATAQGPDAQGWCEAKIPTGLAIDKTVRYEEQASRLYRITWTQSLPGSGSGAGNSGNGVVATIRCQLTGGFPEDELEPAAGAYDPVVFTTARLPWELTVLITLEGLGKSRAADLKFPPRLGSPFLLQRGRSTEDVAPFAVDGAVGKTIASTRYRREARLVYGLATKPPASFAAQLLAAGLSVESYYLEP